MLGRTCRRNHLEKLHAEGKTRKDVEGALQGLPVVSYTSSISFPVAFPARSDLRSLAS
jgi:hypothetical protein